MGTSTWGRREGVIWLMSGSAHCRSIVMHKGRHVYCVLSVLRAVPPSSLPPPVPCTPAPPLLLRPPLQWCNGGDRWEPEKWDDVLLLTYSLTNVVLLPFPALLHALISLLPKSTQLLFCNMHCFHTPLLHLHPSFAFQKLILVLISFLKAQSSLPLDPISV